jgi:hypothetical protein
MTTKTSVYDDDNSVINMYKSICGELVDDIEYYSLIKEDRKFYSPSKLYGPYDIIYNGIYKPHDDYDDDNSDNEDENIHKYKGDVKALMNKDINKSCYSIVNLQSVDDVSDEHEEGLYLKPDVEIDGKIYLSDWDGNVFTDDLSAWGFKKGEALLKIGEHRHKLKPNSDKYEFIPNKYDDYLSYIATMDIYKKYR